MWTLMAWASIALNPNPELPPYFVDLIQERTLFSCNEPILVYVRLGNQSESTLKPKHFPAFFDCLHMTQGDREIPIRQGLDDTKLREKIGVLGRNAHIDIPMNLSQLFPELVNGGVFQLTFADAYGERRAHPIKILEIDLPDPKTIYRVVTSMGDFDLQLDYGNAPNHARNFALLASSGFYADMEFFRVVRKKIIQTGDPQNNGLGGSGFPVKLEFSPFLKHEPYCLGMARAQDPDSAESQFYVCLQRMPDLDQNYTVFGRVVDGFETVDRIGDVGTTGPRGNPPDHPFEPVLLKHISVLSPPQ